MKYKILVTNADDLGIEYVLNKLERCGLKIIRGETQYVVIDTLEQLRILVKSFSFMTSDKLKKTIHINNAEIEIDF